MLRALLRRVLRLLARIFLRLEVEGLDNVPLEGGLILAVNHMSWLDAPIVFALVDRKDITALVAEKYQTKPFFRFLVNAVNGIWINRFEADLQALRAATEYLKRGGALGIAPEGTRSQTGQLLQAKTGVAYLAERSGVPIVPVGIAGTENGFRLIARLRRPKIVITFGEPFYLPPLEKRNRSQSLLRNTEEIMCRIARLLPAQYHGFYAGHPCLEELLAKERQEI